MEFYSDPMGKTMLRLLQTPEARKCHKNFIEDQNNTDNILSNLEIVLKVSIFYSLLSIF